jgi:hypothetical protein
MKHEFEKILIIPESNIHSYEYSEGIKFPEGILCTFVNDAFFRFLPAR